MTDTPATPSKKALKPISAHGEKVQSKRGVLSEHDDAAFQTWYDLGRNYTKAAQTLTVSKTSLLAHARKNDWKARAAKRTELVQAKTDEKMADRMARENVRLFDSFGKAHRHAEAALDNPKLLPKNKHLRPIHIVQVTEALEKITKNQRLIAGEATDRSEVTMKSLVLVASARLDQRPTPAGS